MTNNLDDVITRLAQIETLLEEHDEWTSRFWTLKYKLDLMRTYGSGGEEVAELIHEIDDKMREAESVLEGAKLKLSELTRSSVEESRLRATEIRTFLMEMMNRYQKESALKAHELDEDSLRSTLFDLAFPEE